MTQKNYTKSELADLYGISYSKFNSELHTMGYYLQFPKAKNKKILSPKQKQFIINELGEPNID